MAYLNLLGYYEKDKDTILRDLLKSSIQNSVHLKSTFSAFKFAQEFRNKKLEDLHMLNSPYNELFLKDRYGELLRPFKGLVFDEKYFEKGCIFKKTYILFDHSLPS